jgi:hypothetical protein
MANKCGVVGVKHVCDGHSSVLVFQRNGNNKEVIRILINRDIIILINRDIIDRFLSAIFQKNFLYPNIQHSYNFPHPNISNLNPLRSVLYCIVLYCKFVLY